MIFVLVAGAVSLVVALLGTPLLIKLLLSHGYSQAIRVSTADEPYPEHEGKRGTPSMGGVAIILAVLLGYTASHLVSHRAPSVSGLLALFLMLGLGVVGMIDDYLKIFRRRSTGWRARA